MGSDNTKNRPFGRDQERRQWSRWDLMPQPERERAESDPQAVDRLIEATACRFAQDGSRRDDRGRWEAGGRSDPERDVRIHLTREAYGLTVNEVGVMFGLKRRTSVMQALRRGRELIERNRREKGTDPEPPPVRLPNEPKW